MLTASQIKDLQPRDKPYKVSDSRDLFVRIDPTGAKYWVMNIVRQGKRSTKSLGKFPDVSAVEARRKRDASLGEIEVSKTGVNFRRIAETWHKHKSTSLTSDKYKAQILARLEADVFPQIGDSDISDISRATLVDVVQRVAGRGTIVTARKLCGYIEEILDMAVDLGAITTHSGTRLERVLPIATESHHAALSPADSGRLYSAMWSYSAEVATSCAMRLMALTVVRAQELALAKWDEIIWDENMWVIPWGRMKVKRKKLPHVVPLSWQAKAEFERLREINGDREYVFATIRSKHIHPETVSRAIKRLGFDGEQTGHGLRAIFSTAANESGLWTRDVIERQLAHGESDEVRAAYNRAQYLDTRVKMMQWWADWIDTSRVKP